MSEIDADSNNNTTSASKNFEIKSEIFDKLKAEDLIRGLAPKNIEERCLDLCKSFIGGSWCLAKNEDVKVTRISGGMTNQLWHVKLNDDFVCVPNDVYSDEPKEVAIKLFQPKHMKNYEEEDSERLNDIVILTSMAEAGIGPQIYGIFTDGFIQAFYKHEQFRAKHQQDPKLLDEMIEILAKIHNLKVPIRKTKNLLFKDFGKMITNAYNSYPVREVSKEMNYKYLADRDLTDEWILLQRIIEKLNTPTVFCHCDFRGSNLLVTEKGIICVDLEYSMYGSRPYDISTILNEWGKTELLDRTMGRVPEDSVIYNFINIYIDHCERLVPGYASKPENKPEVIYKEVRIFFLVIYMFFLSIMVNTNESLIPNMPFDKKVFLGHCDQAYGFYKTIKEDLCKQGLIDEEDL